MTLISGTHRCSVGENSDSIHRFLFFLPSFDLFQSLCRSFPTQLRLWTGTEMFVIHKRLRSMFIKYLHPFFDPFTRPWIFNSLLQSSLKQPYNISLFFWVCLSVETLIMCDTSHTGSIVRFSSNLMQANNQCHPQWNQFKATSNVLWYHANTNRLLIFCKRNSVYSIQLQISEPCKEFSPVCHPPCRSSSPLQSRALWRLWCRSGPVHRNGLFSCSEESSLLSGASLRSAPLSRALDGWSPCFRDPLRRWPWCCPETEARGTMPPQPWRSLTSWGSHSLCNPTFCRLQSNCKHSFHLLGWGVGKKRGYQRWII